MQITQKKVDFGERSRRGPEKDSKRDIGNIEKIRRKKKEDISYVENHRHDDFIIKELYE